MIKIKEILIWLIGYSDINKCEYISEETLKTYIREVLKNNENL